MTGRKVTSEILDEVCLPSLNLIEKLARSLPLMFLLLNTGMTVAKAGLNYVFGRSCVSEKRQQRVDF